jgi:hypothetical protein
MKTNLIFLAVVVMLAANEVEERSKNWRLQMRHAQDVLWIKYDDMVNRVLDTLEKRKIIRSTEYGTKAA